MSVDPTGAPDDPPPPADPWPPASGPPSDPSAPPTAPLPPYAPPPSSPYPPEAGQPHPVIAQIGEIAVTSSTVWTPSGAIALPGSHWHVADYWQSEQKTPTWAIVLAVVGFCVLTVFSLLFLLVKETIHRGTVQVTVTNGGRQYVARIPVSSEPQVQQIHRQVNYVRSLATI